MARLGRLGFLGVAVVFHLAYLFSIFDIYFVSPIVSGMSAFKLDTPKAPARRLVLYVGDGLRADKAFQYFPDPSPNANGPQAELPRPMAPFLRSKVLDSGTFGVSHTRVPTESRPGHVALIAGLYEDVSAVTTGWQLNPVTFDSVFNRSTHTWSWGSPDILPMFSIGADPGRVTDHTYGAEFEDFSKDAKELDYWVFDHVRDFFAGAASNYTLADELRQDGNVFFLHLLGLDTTGHSYRPYSQEYLHNIQVVDEGVKKTTELIDRYFGDDSTAYIFTADHGMSDWGSHGDGHPDNTRTPLIAWGSGVAKPRKADGVAPGHEDGFSADWDLDHIHRNDVAQADIAPLMAYLAGLEFPVNSVGELPLPYLASDAADKAQAMLVNAQEILEMYRVKEEQKRATVVQYKAFRPLAGDGNDVQQRIASIEDLIDDVEYDAAIEASEELIQLGLQGLRYLQTYDWLFLRTLVTIGYLGWITFAFTTALDVYVLNSKVDTDRTLSTVATSGAVLVALFGFLLIQASPFTYYIYAFFPVVFWEEVLARRQALIQGSRLLLARWTKDNLRSSVVNVAVYVLALETMVQSYYNRELYSYVYLVAVSWPLFQGTEFVQKNWKICLTWALSCACMSAFTFLPAIKTESTTLILLGGFLILLLGASFLIFEQTLLKDESSQASNERDNFSRTLFGIQVGLVPLAMVVTRSSVLSLQAKQGLPLGAQVVGWLTLIASLVLPFVHAFRPRAHYLHRLAIVFVAFGPLFVILTISYEGLFYFAISITLLSWVQLEHRIHDSNKDRSQASVKQNGTYHASTEDASSGQKDAATLLAPIDPTQPETFRSLAIADARICLFFLYLLQSSFFSTGNIASISSFSLDAVYRLIPIFDPFSQGALLLLKLLAPFALVSANLGILTQRLRLRGGSLFAIVMGISDYLTLRFFWEVKDEGSWLDIGESISVFVIASLLCIFVAGLEALSEVLLRGVRFHDEGSQSQVSSRSSTDTVKATKA